MAYSAPVPSSPPVASAAYATNAGNANYANTAGYADSSGLPNWNQESNSYVGQTFSSPYNCAFGIWPYYWTNNTNNMLYTFRYYTSLQDDYAYSGNYFVSPGQRENISCGYITIISAYSN